MTIHEPVVGVVDLRVIEQRWDITYRHAAGETASHFFNVLEIEQRLVGKLCPTCQRVLVPPRSFCDRCYVETTDWVRLGETGRLEAFTIVHQGFDGLPDPPYCLGYVLLENASTAILNFVRDVDLSNDREALSKLFVGSLVRTVFAQECQGRMTDFWFEVS